MNEAMDLHKVKLEHSLIGSYSFYALTPVKERIYNEEDFAIEECEEINSLILKEASTFVTFMQAIISEILGKEDSMMNVLRGSNNGSESDSDEDFY